MLWMHAWAHLQARITSKHHNLTSTCCVAALRRHRGATPLHFAAAAKRNAAEACEVLLAAGADPNVVDEMG